MAILVWLFVTAVMFALSIAWCAFAAFSMGPYTVGSIPKYPLLKVCVILAGLVLAAAWWLLVIDPAPIHAVPK